MIQCKHQVDCNELEMSNMKTGSVSLATGFRIYFLCHFRQGNYKKITVCQIT